MSFHDSGGSPVDHLTDALCGLELSSGNQAAKRAQEIATPASQARPRARPRQADNKENSNDDGDSITPSRLTCFKQLRDELACAVCLDICVRPCTTPCGHNYCRSCLRRNVEFNRPCPKCRASLPAGFTLNINTTLWNTIQHLFPKEAGEKPLTPPQPLPQRAAAQRQLGTSSYGNPAAAPFRPPRFLPSGDAMPPPFTGQSSSRTNAAAAVRMAGGGIGLASRSGRSVSGPRPQRQPPTASAAAAPLPSTATVIQAAPAPLVYSLAELGVRAAREGPHARRERRRSRSAERWDGESSLLATATGNRGVNVAPVGAPVASRSSVLLELLAEGPSSSVSVAAAAQGRPPARIPRAEVGRGHSHAASGSGADPSANAANGLSLNPFMRVLRPIITRPPAVTSTAVAGAGGGSHSSNDRTDTAPERAGANGGGCFTASQRALRGARANVTSSTSERDAVPRSNAPSAANTDRGWLGSAGAPVSGGVSATVSRSSSSYLCVDSVARSSSSGSSVSTLDDVSALELMREDQPPRLRATSSGGSSALVPSRRVTGGGDTAEDQAGLGVRVGQGSRADTRDQGATRVAAVQRMTGSAEVLVAAVAATRHTSAPGLAGAAHAHLLGRLGDDEEITLEGLDILSPAGLTVELPAPLDAMPFAEGGRPDTTSPTWEQLDIIMARGLQSVQVSPTSLPRLRLPARQSVYIAVPATQPHGPYNSLGRSGGSADAEADVLNPEHGDRHRSGGLDPDLPSNYDGEDPSAADTFFSSPFFDRTMLWDSLDDDKDNSEQGSEAGFSPSWAAGRAGRLQPFGSPSVVPDAAAGGSGGPDHGAPAAGGRQSRARVPGGLSLALGHGPTLPTLESHGLQAGDRGCPIEIISDSDDESLESGMNGADHPTTAQQACRRVVPGLRRPQRA